ncbi:hypothetical protein THAOC_13363 [Thalassiosira oceanica]|uniref:Uncharacterized protein n=1 Tax=Thalassiosira oceanica TaxID=159749 RepID=K0SXM5_THAOC|nr:hypothetical protein THAOC_13363 [Thalassiosira oceanica]|eukprot:EJK65751.1 hypothetical protein THAOC_13363 [Thalassiosira oceanica]
MGPQWGRLHKVGDPSVSSAVQRARVLGRHVEGRARRVDAARRRVPRQFAPGIKPRARAPLSSLASSSSLRRGVHAVPDRGGSGPTVLAMPSSSPGVPPTRISSVTSGGGTGGPGPVAQASFPSPPSSSAGPSSSLSSSCHRSSAHAADDEERNSLTSPGSRRRIDRRPSEDAAAEDDPDAEDDCAAEDDPMEDDCHRLRCGVVSLAGLCTLACRRLPSRRQTTSAKDFRRGWRSIPVRFCELQSWCTG